MKLRKAAAVVLLVSALSACAVTPAERPPRAQLTGQEILAEYRSESSRLELAAEDTWVAVPPELALASPDPARPMRYEEGVGAQTAQFQWYCSWARQALTDSEPTASLDRLEQFPSMSVWADMDSVGHSLFSQNIDDARVGNLETLTDYVTDYCAQA